MNMDYNSSSKKVELWDLFQEKREEKAQLEGISSQLSLLFENQQDHKKGASKFWK